VPFITKVNLVLLLEHPIEEIQEISPHGMFIRSSHPAEESVWSKWEEYQETEENCLVSSFIICTLKHILFG